MMDLSEMKCLVERYINQWAPYNNTWDFFNLIYDIQSEVVTIWQSGVCCGDKSSIPIIKIVFDKLESNWQLFWFNLDHWTIYDCGRLSTLEEALKVVDENESFYFV